MNMPKRWAVSHEEAVQRAAETPLAIREKARERLRAIAYETIKLARTLTPAAQRNNDQVHERFPQVYWPLRQERGL